MIYNLQKKALETLVSRAVADSNIPVIYDNLPEVKEPTFIRLHNPGMREVQKTLSENKVIQMQGIANALIITQRNSSSIKGNEIASLLFERLMDQSIVVDGLRMVILGVNKLNEEQYHGNYLVDVGIVYKIYYNYKKF